MILLRIALFAGLLVLQGCNYDPTEAGRRAPAPQPSPAASASKSTDAGRTGAWAVPAALSECDATRGTTGTIHWNYGDRAEAHQVRIFVADATSPEALFAEGGASGSATTAAWLRPGLRFVLRDDAGGLLDTVVLGHVPCR